MAPWLHLTTANAVLGETRSLGSVHPLRSLDLSTGISSVPEPRDAGAGAQGWHAVLLTPIGATSYGGRSHHKLKAQLHTTLRRDFFFVIHKR